MKTTKRTSTFIKECFLFALLVVAFFCICYFPCENSPFWLQDTLLSKCVGISLVGVIFYLLNQWIPISKNS